MLSHGRGAHAATAIGSARPTQVASPPARRRAAPRPRTRSAAQAAPPSQDGASTSGRGEDHQQAAAILVEHAGLTAEDAALAARALAGACPDLLRASAAALAARFKPSHVRHIAVHAPGALRLDVKSWVTFLEKWAGDDVVWSVLRHQHEALAETDVFKAGRAILFLKRLGPWSDNEIATRVLACHARLLAQEEAALEALLARLRGLGLEEERVRELLYHCPGLLYDFGDESLALAERVWERNRTKYAFMGSYEV